jgi:uncharacterized membrane protein
MLPVLASRRADLVSRLGPVGYRVGFSILAGLGLVAIIYGYGMARADGSMALWYPPVWTRHLTLALMVPVFVLLVAAYLPTGHIRKRTRHPMILAVKLWAFAHLLANGDLASVLLFGGFLAWGVIDRISLKRRGDAGGAAVASVAALSDAVALIAGLAIYVAFVLWLHPLLIGVPVM